MGLGWTVLLTPASPFRHKLLKWWAQSFLPGVPHVIAGFRNPEGFVCSLKTFPTMEMFENVRVRQSHSCYLFPSPPHPCTPTSGPSPSPLPLQNDPDGWNPSVCMNFCDAFLSFAQSTVVQDDPR